MTTARDVAASPQLYPVAYGRDQSVRLIGLSEDDYRAASFLDERLLVPGRRAMTIGWLELAASAAAIPLACDFIFHIGHVGSTLLARILGAHERVFALREPALLRPLAAETGAEAARLETLLRLYSRPWRAGQRSLVKATSFVSRIGPEMLRAEPGARAVLMAVGAPTFISGILGGPATRAEAPRTGAERLERLARRLDGAAPAASSLGELAAASWITEIWALADIAAAYPDRILWLDFDDFLLDPRGGLTAVLRRLFGEASPRDLGALLASPDMGRYSKAPEHPFGPGVRGATLRRSAHENAVEIARGRAWLDRLAKGEPTVARILSERGRLSDR